MDGGTAGNSRAVAVCLPPAIDTQNVLSRGIYPFEGVRGAPTVQPRRAARIPPDESATPTGSTRQRPGSRAGALACSRAGVSAAPAPQHDAEQQVAPRRLRERASIARQPRQLCSRGMEAVGQAPERPQPEVLDLRDERPAQRRAAAAAAARERRRRRRRTARRSARAARGRAGTSGGAPRAEQRSPEQLHVVVAAAEDALVERLLERPRRRRRPAGERAPRPSVARSSAIVRTVTPRSEGT